MKNYAVLTGDLVGSGKLGPERLEAAMSLLRRLAQEFNKTWPDSVVGRPDVFRGDSWQLCLQRPALAVTAAVFIRAGFKADELDSRVGIGIGPVERLHPEHISQSLGPAFTLSGEVLDNLGTERRLSLASAGCLNVGAGAHSPIDPLIAGVLLLDAHLTSWTAREAVAAFGTLCKLSQEAIAALPQARTRAGKISSRQNIQKALKRICWSSHLLPFLEEAEAVLSLRVGS